MQKALVVVGGKELPADQAAPSVTDKPFKGGHRQTPQGRTQTQTQTSKSQCHRQTPQGRTLTATLSFCLQYESLLWCLLRARHWLLSSSSSIGVFFGSSWIRGLLLKTFPVRLSLTGFLSIKCIFARWKGLSVKQKHLRGKHPTSNIQVSDTTLPPMTYWCSLLHLKLRNRRWYSDISMNIDSFKWWQ